MKMEPVNGEMPLDISKLMDGLLINVNLFMSQFDSVTVRMSEIDKDFQGTAYEFRKVPQAADVFRKMVENRLLAATAGLGVTAIVLLGLLGLLFAPVTKGQSVILTAVALLVGLAKISRVFEGMSARKAETLGVDFESIIEPMKRSLKAIKATCEKLKLKSYEVQAEQTLNDIEEFTMITRITTMINMGEEIRGASLGAFIIQSAEQCKKVIHEMKTMKDKLENLTGH